jgi:hypothetical protein
VVGTDAPSSELARSLAASAQADTEIAGCFTDSSSVALVLNAESGRVELEDATPNDRGSAVRAALPGCLRGHIQWWTSRGTGRARVAVVAKVTPAPQIASSWQPAE